MLRKIKLQGALGKKFQRTYDLDVETPAEAIRALIMMVPGFRAYVEPRAYQVKVVSKQRKETLGPDDFHVGLPDAQADIHIIPRALGAKDEAVGKVILGTLLVAASFAIPGSWALLGKPIAAMVGQMGVAMVLGGVSQMLMPRVEPDGLSDQERSDLFSGGVNRTALGAPIPVVFGECEVPVIIVSAATHVEDRVV